MNLLVTGAFAWSREELHQLRELGHEVVYMQQEKDRLPCDAAWVEGIVGNGIFLSHPIEQFSALRLIQLTSAGFDRVPMDYIRAHGIEIFNAGGVYSIPMAEFAVGGVLQLYKQSGFFRDRQKEHRWEKHRGLLELDGKTVCILGCGSVGSACAKRFRAFGCRVEGIDVFPYESEHYERMLPLAEMEKGLANADITVITVPLTAETHHLIHADRLAGMKAGSVLVNISRGGVIDTDALIAALKTHLGGAVLDVFETEPLPDDSPLWDMDHVILSPHNSFVGDGNHARMLHVILHNLEGR